MAKTTRMVIYTTDGRVTCVDEPLDESDMSTWVDILTHFKGMEHFYAENHLGNMVYFNPANIASVELVETDEG